VTEIINNLQGDFIANFANEVTGNARQQANQHIHPSVQQNLAQAIKQIQEILSQLDQSYDWNQPIGQTMITAKAVEAIEKQPTLKARVINALKEGSASALEESIDHPAIKPIIATL
jgi:hypothetical protein